MGHMIEANRPIAGNAYSDKSGGKQRQTQAGVRSDGECEKYALAVEQLEQDHADEATCCQQSPEPRDGVAPAVCGLEP